MTQHDEAAEAGNARRNTDRARLGGLASNVRTAAPTLALFAIAGSICWLALEVREVGRVVGYIDDQETVEAINGLSHEVKEASERLEPPPAPPPVYRPNSLPGLFDR